MFTIYVFNKSIARYFGVAILIGIVTYIAQIYGQHRTPTEPTSRGSAIQIDTHQLYDRSRADAWPVSRIIIPLEQESPSSAADDQLMIVPIKTTGTELDRANAGVGPVYAIGLIDGGPYYNLLRGVKNGDELLLKTVYQPSRRLQVIRGVEFDCQQGGSKRNVSARYKTHCPQQNLYWILVRVLEDPLHA